MSRKLQISSKLYVAWCIIAFVNALYMVFVYTGAWQFLAAILLVVLPIDIYWEFHKKQ